MTSSRLPGKILMPLDAEGRLTVLEAVVRRVGMAEGIGRIIVATTENGTDDPTAQLVERLGAMASGGDASCGGRSAEETAAVFGTLGTVPIHCFRGSETDVLARYYEAAKAFGLDVIVRVTSDCPFIDPALIEDLVARFQREAWDYVNNTTPRSYPHGMDCEAFTFEALEKAHAEGQEQAAREHVTWYLYSRPDRFRIGQFPVSETDLSRIRLTVDTPQDFALACLVEKYLDKKGMFYIKDLAALFEKKPWLYSVNEGVIQKKIFESLAEEVAAAIPLLQERGLDRAASCLRKNANTGCGHDDGDSGRGDAPS